MVIRTSQYLSIIFNYFQPQIVVYIHYLVDDQLSDPPGTTHATVGTTVGTTVLRHMLATIQDTTSADGLSLFNQIRNGALSWGYCSGTVSTKAKRLQEGANILSNITIRLQ